MFKNIKTRFWLWSFHWRQKRERYCNFCGKKPNEVRCLVAGPRVYICEGCVQIAADFVVQHLEKTAEKLKAAADKIPTQDEYSGDKS